MVPLSPKKREQEKIKNEVGDNVEMERLSMCVRMTQNSPDEFTWVGTRSSLVTIASVFPTSRHRRDDFHLGGIVLCGTICLLFVIHSLCHSEGKCVGIQMAAL